MAGTLAVADICATGLAVILGFRVWSLINPSIPPVQLVMSLAPVFCAAMFAFESLYPGIGMGAVEHIRRVSRGGHARLPDAHRGDVHDQGPVVGRLPRRLHSRLGVLTRARAFGSLDLRPGCSATVPGGACPWWCSGPAKPDAASSAI